MGGIAAEARGHAEQNHFPEHEFHQETVWTAEKGTISPLYPFLVAAGHGAAAGCFDWMARVALTHAFVPPTFGRAAADNARIVGREKCGSIGDDGLADGHISCWPIISADRFGRAGQPIMPTGRANRSRQPIGPTNRTRRK